MRAKSLSTILCFSALSFVLCASAGLRAQTSPPPAQPASSSALDSANDLSVLVGKTVLVDTEWPIKRASIGASEIAEVHGTSPTEIMVSGKTAGETSLIVWDTHGGRQFFNVTVRASVSALNDSLDMIRRELRAEFPGDALKISSENGSIFLRGTVKNLESSARAVKIAATGGKVVNLLNVAVPASDPQILLKVRFASVDRSKEKQLGFNIYSTGALNTTGGVSANGATGAAASASSALTVTIVHPGNLPFGMDITALEAKGVVEVLAEPNLLATNGKEASFLAGGEYPFPMVQGGSGGSGSSVTIMFKEYGIRLNFIPTITPRGTIRLQVAPEVSSLDFTNAITISGFTVPAIATRKMKTEVELSDGQSFVIGGLLDNRDTETYKKIPFLGDIPVLGKFFQSMDKKRTNTELLVSVTPEFVAPIPVGGSAPELKFPTKFLPTNSGIPLNTPDAKTPENTLPPPPPTVTVEKLIESMKEKPLVVEGGSGTFGGGSGDTTTSSTPTAPQQ